MAVAFIVDGRQEQEIVRRLCGKKVPVHCSQMNGKDVEIDRLAQTLFSHVELLQKRHALIVIVVDREGRTMSALEMERALQQKMIANGCAPDSILVAVADTMIENWIAAGRPACEVEGAAHTIDLPGIEGKNGKAVLKRKLHELGMPYRETGNGVDLFLKMNFETASQCSESFGRFYRAIFNHCPSLRYKSVAT